jgi:ferredoxin
MATKEFLVDQDLCTGCGDCYKALPKNFRDTGADTAEVYDVNCDDVAKLEEVMKKCPGKAILWKK